MRSIKFPHMFGTNTTKVWKSDEYLQSTSQNVVTLMLSGRGELFGDPYIGLLFKRYLFNQNSAVLRDMLIDAIYTQLALFLPQVKVERKNIKIIQSKSAKGRVVCRFTGINQIDYQPNTYNLVMYQETTEI